jgi:hypothetical protein
MNLLVLLLAGWLYFEFFLLLIILQIAISHRTTYTSSHTYLSSIPHVALSFHSDALWFVLFILYMRNSLIRNAAWWQTREITYTATFVCISLHTLARRMVFYRNHTLIVIKIHFHILPAASSSSCIFPLHLRFSHTYCGRVYVIIAWDYYLRDNRRAYGKKIFCYLELITAMYTLLQQRRWLYFKHTKGLILNYQCNWNNATNTFIFKTSHSIN